MKQMLQAIANSNIPVSYRLFIAARLIVLICAFIIIYAGATCKPFTVANVVLIGMGIAALFTWNK